MLSQPKPRQEDVQPLQNEWHVAQQQNKKRRPLADVIQEFQDKVINAAKELQQQLSETAQQPASSTVEQSASMDTADDASQLAVQSTDVASGSAERLASVASGSASRDYNDSLCDVAVLHRLLTSCESL